MNINKKIISVALLLGLTVTSHVEARGGGARRLSEGGASVPARYVAAAIVVASAAREKITVKIPDSLHVDRVVARKLAELEADPSMAVPLDKELKGFVKVTSGDYRIVLRWSGINEMTLIDFGARGGIYEPLARRLKESVKQSAIHGVKSELARQIDASEHFYKLHGSVIRV